jgi:hypothetical protein
MPTSQAALDGIRVNGLRWKFYLRGLIRPETEALGKINDLDADGYAYDDADVERHAKAIVRKMKAWVGDNMLRLGDEACRSLADRLEYLDDYADCGIEEVNDAMNRIYDDFDYYRICAG